MSKLQSNRLMFDEDEVRSTTEHLPRLIRIIFFGLSITNEGYLERYRYYFKGMFPDKTKKEFSQKSTADRKFLLDRRKLTFNMLQNVLIAMGYDIVSVSVEVKDKLTGEVKVFSTSDTVESLKRDIAKDNEIGIQSLM